MYIRRVRHCHIVRRSNLLKRTANKSNVIITAHWSGRDKRVITGS